MNRIKSLTPALSLALAGLAAAGAAWAQAPAPSIQSVITYRVKPDQAATWADLRKQVVAIYKKAGLENTNTVWARQSGTLEYSVVRYYDKWAGLDTPQNPKLKDHQADLRGLNQRMMQCVESMERRLATVTDWSMRGSTTEAPKMVRVLRSTVRSGHINAFLDVLKTESLPAFKQGGAKMYMVSRTMYGDRPNEVVTVTALDKWADLDAPNVLIRALGQSGYEKLLAKLDEHIEGREATIYRFSPELSYIPGAAGGGTATGN